jgi:drug/metabolite transporter (DMT)-like permease
MGPPKESRRTSFEEYSTDYQECVPGKPDSADPARRLPVLAALTVAVLAISVSGPLVAFAAAPALAVAFWRNAAGAAVLCGLAGLTRRHEFRRLFGRAGRRTLAACVLAGLALAVHFGTWIPSLRLTTVATSTALVATQPVWQGLIALGQGRRLPRLVWVGIGVAVAGAAVASGADLVVSGAAFAGDLLAVAGAMAAAMYTALGERARASISTPTYAAVCYSVCSLALLVLCLAARVSLAGFPATTWLAIGGLALGPQLLGHTMFNFALERVSATTVAILILLEVPGASLISWLWLHQAPRSGAWPGLALLLAGVIVVLLGARARLTVAGRAAADSGVGWNHPHCETGPRNRAPSLSPPTAG